MAETDVVDRKYFLSHSTGDDGVVRSLRVALAELDEDVIIDSREFRGGDLLWSEIREAIEVAAGLLVLVSPRAHASTWVGKELKHALEVQKARGGARAFPVVPLLLDGTALGALEAHFDEQPLHVAVHSDALDAALHPILVALGLRLPTDREPAPQPLAEVVEELVLELSDPSIVTHDDGRRRARARAQLVHAATREHREVSGARFALEAPLGVIEADDLRWYLEDYAVWPSPLLGQRAKRIEEKLETWGKALHDAAMPAVAVADVMKSWAAIGTAPVARRFSVEVDARADVGSSDGDVQARREAATLLLGLPWELLHDDRSFLFQGAQPVRVRRRLPNEHAAPVPVLATPIRVLLVSPRPEDDACAYIDHRASAGPMVEAIEALVGQVELRLLTPPTLGALRDELDRARRVGRPYHVLHFDGHGVFDRRVGLGALCFEHEEDAKVARGKRRHAIVPTTDLGALLRDHGIPLVFLEACQTAQAESASESVASALLEAGVASVVAMSHSVLVETARRFVEAFYRALARGERVGSAMLAGQRELKDNTVRGRVFGHGEFTLQDWFVPVLYQDVEDPQLFRETPTTQTVEDWRARVQRRLGALPDAPPQGFVGRSHELLELERLLAVERYAVLRGQGGEGKTALAVEFARWRVRSRQVKRAAFVSVESHGHAGAVLDAIGRQLVGKKYSVATHANLDAAIEPVARALREQSTLLVIDNLESILAPPFADITDAGASANSDTADALRADEREIADAILALASRLLTYGDTRVVFTSREALPAPFDGESQLIELHRLTRADAVQLVERTLGLDAAGQGREAEAQREDIESLVEAVHGHARTLALLAPSLRARGAAATQADLVNLMADMERRFPGQREHSLFASVELSLRRLPPEIRARANVLAVFHGAVDLNVLRHMTTWEPADVRALGVSLVTTGLATLDGYGHLSLNPALCPYLAATADPATHEALAAQWTRSMEDYADFLRQQRNKRVDMAATLTLVELPNLMALLDQVERAGDPAATVKTAATMYSLLQNLNRPGILSRTVQALEAATRALNARPWDHAQFEAARTQVEQLEHAGRVEAALAAAQHLHDRAHSARRDAYAGADYDLAIASFLLGKALRFASQADRAVSFLDDARQRFEDIEARHAGCGAARMASVALSERAGAVRSLGRLDEAAEGYEQAIASAQQRGDDRGVAVNRAQLGTVRLLQRRFGDALKAFIEARDRFETLGESRSVSIAWYQIGIVHQRTGDGDAAGDAYRRALAIDVQGNDIAGQASTLSQLGQLHSDVLSRPAEAVDYLRQAADRYVTLSDVGGESLARNNLARAFLQLGDLPTARREAQRAIECKRRLGRSAEPWTSWNLLAKIERADGDEEAARRAFAHARDAYLAYRREGGVNQNPASALASHIGRLLTDADHEEAGAVVQRVSAETNPPSWLSPFLTAVKAIVGGERDPSIVDTPGLEYDDAAEILLLLEQLKAAGI